MNIATKQNRIEPIALTMGDPAGIGPEITALAWKHYRKTSLRFFLIGEIKLIQNALANADLAPPIAIRDPSECIEIFATGLPVLPISLPQKVIPGQANSGNAMPTILSIEMAVRLCQSRQASAMVTNPIAKSVLYQAGFAHPGHTEFLGEMASGFSNWLPPKGPIMMLCGGGLRVALATVHSSLAQVPSLITAQTIENSLRVLDKSLQQDFAIRQPRIAICGLNPHAGENGTIGTEEREIIDPIAKDLRQQGINVSNAQSADALFHEESRNRYDGFLAMYHDQGLIPVKTLDFHGGTNVTLGLPFVRVSPDHGTGFDIAGKNLARPDSLIAAISMAQQISQNRSLK